MELPPPPPERSKRLHNFTLPYLRWGQQRFLRCVKLPHHHHPSPSTSSPSSDRTAHRSRGEFGPGDAKLRLDLAYDEKPKVCVTGNGGGDDVVAAAAPPWNLRTRRAAYNETGDETGRIVEFSSLRRREIGDGDGDSSKDEKLKFSVSLLREEIEEDFSAIIGKRPPRRPKKRPRMVQKQMNTLFPGLWLAEEVRLDSYEVPAAVET